MLKEIKHKKFANGVVYLLETKDGFPIEVTDTFLPYYTKDAIGRKQNSLKDGNLGSREERWMAGISTMSGCPVGCRFCATGTLKRCRPLTWQEIVDQIQFILHKNYEKYDPAMSAEFKVNYTRMGEPFLNIEAVRQAIKVVDSWGFKVHHYISTIGVKGSDFSWIKDNVTLQLSIHSFDENYRDWLIPYPHKMSLEELGAIRTESSLKTTLNLTMAREEDFNIHKLKELFATDKFFCKISPINENEISKKNEMGAGIISQLNIV